VDITDETTPNSGTVTLSYYDSGSNVFSGTFSGKANTFNLVSLVNIKNGTFNFTIIP